MARITTSPSRRSASAGWPTAGGRSVAEPSGDTSVSPSSRRARRWSPRATRVTSCPASNRRPPIAPPIAPAPYTVNRMSPAWRVDEAPGDPGGFGTRMYCCPACMGGGPCGLGTRSPRRSWPSSPRACSGNDTDTAGDGDTAGTADAGRRAARGVRQPGRPVRRPGRWSPTSGSTSRGARCSAASRRRSRLPIRHEPWRSPHRGSSIPSWLGRGLGLVAGRGGSRIDPRLGREHRARASGLASRRTRFRPGRRP